MFNKLYVYLAFGVVFLLLAGLLVGGIRSIQRANFAHQAAIKKEATDTAINQCNSARLNDAVENNKRISALIAESKTIEERAISRIRANIDKHPTPLSQTSISVSVLVSEPLITILKESKNRWPAE